MGCLAYIQIEPIAHAPKTALNLLDCAGVSTGMETKSYVMNCVCKPEML